MKKFLYTVLFIILSSNANSVTVDNISDLIPQIMPGVVNISTTQKVPVMQNAFFPGIAPFEDLRDFFERNGSLPGFGSQEEPQQYRNAMSLGTGFIIDESGYIVTNNHVVKDADEIKVTLNDESEYEAELVGVDEKTDLALIKVKNGKGKSFPKVIFGDSDKTKVGEWVVTIGNPFGLGNSVSKGIISARGRDISAGNYDDFIQTDASINKGNSGGPMFNLSGEVIGINTAIVSPNGGSVGIGFAIPSNMAQPIINDLKENGKVKRGWLGVVIQPLTKEMASTFGLYDDNGALVSDVVKGGPADKAGIKPKDIILKFNDKEVSSNRSLPRMVVQAEIGSKASVEVYRSGKVKTLKVTVEESPETSKSGKSVKLGSDDVSKIQNKLGMAVVDLNDDLKRQLGLNKDLKGVVINAIRRGSLAEFVRLSKGDVITEVNDAAISSADDFYHEVSKVFSNNKATFRFRIVRNNEAVYVAITIPN